MITTALAATGCHVNTPADPTPAAATGALDELRSLPSLEQTRQQLQAALDETTSAATRLVPSLAWTITDNAESAGCPTPYDQTGGVSAYLPNRLAANAAVSEEQWQGIQAATQAVAARLAATEVQVMQDAPGNHDVGFYGPAGLSLQVTYRGNMVISAYTGCRLP